jgi:DNA-binding XRE family transcriptional regulator
MTAADLRALVAEHPKLGEVTLAELFSQPSAEAETRVRTDTTAKVRFRQPYVGRRLRELRKRAGLTRLALSEAAGIPITAIARIEGGCNARLSTYLPLIEYFISHQPQAWMVADRVTLLDSRLQADLLASLGVLEAAHGRHR